MTVLANQFCKTLGSVFALSLAVPVCAEEFGTSIPMLDKGAATYYVSTQIDGIGQTDFMVDTGSGYATINEETLSQLMQQQAASYVKDLEGILADGSRMVVPVYTIKHMNIGGHCSLENIEVAVFPGKTRQILGLSALRQASPFIFSMNPPELVLSHCGNEVAEVDPKTVELEPEAVTSETVPVVTAPDSSAAPS